MFAPTTLDGRPTHISADPEAEALLRETIAEQVSIIEGLNQVLSITHGEKARRAPKQALEHAQWLRDGYIVRLPRQVDEAAMCQVALEYAERQENRYPNLLKQFKALVDESPVQACRMYAGPLAAAQATDQIWNGLAHGLRKASAQGTLTLAFCTERFQHMEEERQRKAITSLEITSSMVTTAMSVAKVQALNEMAESLSEWRSFEYSVHQALAEMDDSPS